MFGSLDISVSALVAQRTRLTAISANMALRGAAVDPNANPDNYRARIPILAPGDPTTGTKLGVHVKDIHLRRTPFNMVFDPKHVFADEKGYVRYPDIDSAMEMVNALDAARGYEANITAAEATKNMMQVSLRLIA